MKITGVKNSEQKLKEALFFLDVIPDSLLVATSERKITKVNKAFCALWGYTAREVLGRPALEMFPKEEWPKHEKAMEVGMNTGQTQQFETMALTKIGTKIPVAIKGNVTRGLRGTSTLLVAVIEDITGEKEARDEREKLIATLGERVKELKCLYALASIAADSDISPREVFRKTLGIVPPALRYADVARARIVFDGEEFSNSDFRTTEWKESADIEVHGKKRGFIEIVYAEKKHDLNRSPFLKEEKKMLEAIAAQLGRVIGRMEIEKELENKMQRLEQFSKFAVGRELKMKELKRRIGELEARTGGRQ